MAQFLQWLESHAVDLVIIAVTILVAIVCGILRGMSYFAIPIAPWWWWVATPVAWFLLCGAGLFPWRKRTVGDQQPCHRSYWAWTSLISIVVVVLIIGQATMYQRLITGYAGSVSDQVQVATKWGPMYYFRDTTVNTRIDLSNWENEDRAYVVRYGWARPHIVVVDVQRRARVSQGAIRAWNVRPWLREYESTESSLGVLHRYIPFCGNVEQVEVYPEGASITPPEVAN